METNSSEVLPRKVFESKKIRLPGFVPISRKSPEMLAGRKKQKIELMKCSQGRILGLYEHNERIELRPSKVVEVVVRLRKY